MDKILAKKPKTEKNNLKVIKKIITRKILKSDQKTRVISALTKTNDFLLAKNKEKDVSILEEREKNAAEIRENKERSAELEGACL